MRSGKSVKWFRRSTGTRILRIALGQAQRLEEEYQREIAGLSNFTDYRRPLMDFMEPFLAAIVSTSKERRERLRAQLLRAFRLLGLERLAGRPILMYGGGNDNRMDSREGDIARYKRCGADAEVIVYRGKGHVLPPPGYLPRFRDWLERKVARRGLPEATANMKSALAAKRWTAALRFARKIVQTARDGTTGLVAAREAIERISAEGDREIEELLSGSPKAEALLEFAASWTPCRCAKSARDAADRLAGEELERIKAMGGSQRTSKLRSFMSAWERYPVHEEALVAYEEDAAKALAALERHRATARKLKRFVDKWSPAPSARRALEKLEVRAEKELAKIMATKSPSSRRSRLRSFARDYQGTQSASKAQETLEEMREEEAAKILAGIKTRSARQQKSLLAVFLKSFPGTEAAKEAQKLLDGLSRRR